MDAMAAARLALADGDWRGADTALRRIPAPMRADASGELHDMLDEVAVERISSNLEEIKLREGVTSIQRLVAIENLYKRNAAHLRQTAGFSEAMERALLHVLEELPVENLGVRKRAYEILSDAQPSNSAYAGEVASAHSRMEAQQAAKQAAQQTQKAEAEARRAKQIRELLAGYRRSYDRVTDVSFYSHPAAPSGTGTELYIAHHGSGRFTLRWRTAYTARMWLFADKVEVRIDDKLVDLIPKFDSNRISGGAISETYDVIPTPADIKLLEEMANGKTVIMRFKNEGRVLSDRDWRDHTMTAGERRAIRETLAAYQKLTGAL